MSLLGKIKGAAKSVGGAVADVAEDTYDVAKDGVKAIGKGLEAITDPIQKMADNPVFRAIDKAYKGAMPEPYRGYMKIMCSSSALVGSALSKAKLLPGKGILLSGGQSVMPGSATYGEITKKGKAAQLKAVGDLVEAAANTPEAKRALAEMRKAAPQLLDQLVKESSQASAATRSVVAQVRKHASPETQRAIARAVTTGVMAPNVLAAARAGNAQARATVDVADALRAARSGDTAKAARLVRSSGKGAVQTMYRVTTPSGRVVLVPRAEVER